MPTRISYHPLETINWSGIQLCFYAGDFKAHAFHQYVRSKQVFCTVWRFIVRPKIQFPNDTQRLQLLSIMVPDYYIWLSLLPAIDLIITFECHLSSTQTSFVNVRLVHSQFLTPIFMVQFFVMSARLSALCIFLECTWKDSIRSKKQGKHWNVKENAIVHLSWESWSNFTIFQLKSNL